MRTRVWRGGITRGSTRVIAPPKRCFSRCPKPTRRLSDPGRRQQYDRSGPPGTASSRPRRSMFAEFDFSVARQGAQASTFTELFADVLHPVPTANGAPARGRERSARGADRDVRRCGEGRRAAGDRDAPGAVQRLRRARARAGSGSEVPDVPGHRAGPLGARAHGVVEDLRDVCRRRASARGCACAVCGGQGRTVRSESMAVPVPAGIADGSRLRAARARPRRALRRPGRRPFRGRARAAAPDLSSRGRRPRLRSSGGGARGGPGGAHRCALARRFDEAADPARHAGGQRLTVKGVGLPTVGRARRSHLRRQAGAAAGARRAVERADARVRRAQRRQRPRRTVDGGRLTDDLAADSERRMVTGGRRIQRMTDLWPNAQAARRTT